jgi:hypothetical protein
MGSTAFFPQQFPKNWNVLLIPEMHTYLMHPKLKELLAEKLVM